MLVVRCVRLPPGPLAGRPLVCGGLVGGAVRRLPVPLLAVLCNCVKQLPVACWLAPSTSTGTPPPPTTATPSCRLTRRDVWKQYTAPGTFRAFCRAVISWACGKGFVFDVPTIQAEAIPDLGSTQSTRDADNW